MTQKDACTSNKLRLQNHSLTFIHQKKSLFSRTGFLSRSPLVYDTTVSFEKLVCTNYVDFGKRQGNFGQFFRIQSYFQYLDVKLIVFNKEDN